MKTIQPIARFDLAFSLFCLQHRFNLPVARISKAISHTGDGHLYAVMGVLAWGFEAKSGQYFLMAGLLAFLLELPIYWLVKNSFKRRRPAQISHLLTSYITPSDQYSLPSGHTAAAFLMAVLLQHYYPELGFLPFVWAGFIGFSRILLGVHFFTDIVLGAALGISCALTAIHILAGG